MADDPLSHFDAAGRAHVVALDDKPESSRAAVARATVRMAPQTLLRIRQGVMGKGDVLGVARVAAITATKATAHAIPLCHPVRITSVDVAFGEVEPCGIQVRVEVGAIDRTGPEMEAMHAATIAALTIYDMCKAMDRGMVIESVMLLEKRGGKSGHWLR